MSPAGMLAKLYEERGLSFAWYRELHEKHGFYFATPQFAIMGRPVDRYADVELIRDPTHAFALEQQNAWWIHAMAGDCHRAWSILPWSLGWLGWERFDSDLRWYPVETIRRLTTVGNDFLRSPMPVA